MRENIFTWSRTLLMAIVFALTGTCEGFAQKQLSKDAIEGVRSLIGDSLQTIVDDSMKTVIVDSLQSFVANNQELIDSIGSDINQKVSNIVDSTLKKQPKPAKDMSLWRPDPKRAMWLALVIPGGGQIYNRKYWKLPIVYGGFIGCLYAMNWNNTMYKDYSQAYLDLMDNDPGTQSYNQFLHLGAQINSTNTDYYKQIFKKRKDRFRRYRDLSFFILVGVYALSVIDAYVDAELSVFDISKDLSLKVEPTIMNNQSSSNPLDASSLGLHCSLNF